MSSIDSQIIRKIIIELINESYHSLENKKLLIFRIRLGVFWGAALWPLPFLRMVLVSPKANKLSESKLKGLLAHELAHHEIYSARGWLKYIITSPYIYFFSSQQRIKEENATDELAIKRGYGKYLYELKEALDQDFKHQKVNHYYLTKDQIQDRVEKLGK